MAFGMTFQHRLSTAADLVDVVYLPASVMHEVDRRSHDQEVVVFDGTAQEGGFVAHIVADFEAQPVDEEPHRRFEVDGTDHGVTQLARLYRPPPSNERCAAPTVDASGAVVRGGSDGWFDNDPGPDLDGDPSSRNGFTRRAHDRRAMHLGAQGGEPRGGACDVVLVIGCDGQLD
ncbi:hypothetical protein AU184_20115 [Mycolicibacterium novocastrense]|nr:hypothetical protein AU072_03910 [Mycolicibacterium novocastrense]KUH72134.1 hypothetical protein AU183_26695 [Mycolicibacterium novocastrense]KUH73085.1 hypothetical protein AU184_20115 [Mycolicibacterium novocastrense]